MILSDSQRNVIRAIAELKKSTIGRIAQKTGMHRQSIKIILAKLAEMSIVKTEKVSNKILYSLENVHTIQNRVLGEFDKIKSAIPSLKADYEETKDSQIINAVSGNNGLRTVLMDEIIKGKEICAFHLSPLYKKFEQSFIENDSRRKKHNVPLRILTNQDISVKDLCRIRKTKLQSKVDVYVYANKITIFYDNADTAIFTIKINEVSKMFKDLFEKKWKM